MFQLTLDCLCPGQYGEIVGIKGSKRLRKRLIEMGVTAGTRLRMVKCAPLGDPIQFYLRGYSLAIARTAAAKILIKRVF